MGATGTANFDVWATFTSGGSLITRQIQGDGIDQHLAYVTSSNAYWYLTDHLGSTRATINNSGTVQDSIVYDAYGNITSQSNASAAPLYTYTGRELDVATGLQYNRARWYDPGTVAGLRKTPWASTRETAIFTGMCMAGQRSMPTPPAQHQFGMA